MEIGNILFGHSRGNYEVRERRNLHKTANTGIEKAI